MSNSKSPDGKAGDRIGDRPRGSHFAKSDTSREILFPTEPSTIGNDRIDLAIERVLARKQ